jgi:hypothetical protein
VTGITRDCLYTQMREWMWQIESSSFCHVMLYTCAVSGGGDNCGYSIDVV